MLAFHCSTSTWIAWGLSRPSDPWVETGLCSSLIFSCCRIRFFLYRENKNTPSTTNRKMARMPPTAPPTEACQSVLSSSGVTTAAGREQRGQPWECLVLSVRPAVIDNQRIVFFFQRVENYNQDSWSRLLKRPFKAPPTPPPATPPPPPPSLPPPSLPSPKFNVGMLVVWA